MAGRLAVDFGTSNSVVAVWDETRQEATSLHVPEYGRLVRQGEDQISVVPSLIHYDFYTENGENDPDRERIWLGNQVLQRNLYRSNQTFRWMKRYILNRSPLQRQVNGRRISPQTAGLDFLSRLLVFAAEETGLGDDEIALTIPVEAFEHYENWLEEAAETAGIRRLRLIDEPSAAALGYGAHIQPGDVYLIFDFGGGTLHAAIVIIEAEATAASSAQSSRRCRVLGKAGLEMGGTTIDQWLFEEVLKRNGRQDSEEDIRQISGSLLVECERLKEQLSSHEQASLSVINPISGAALWAEFNRQEFETLLEDRGAFTDIDRTIRRAINVSREHGYGEEEIKSVFLVGGSSQIPAIQQILRRIFGKERVKVGRPLDAIARGAAAFVAGVDFYDYIQHDYAIRFVNRQKGEYDYRVLVPRGTAYPTREPVARLTIKATYDGQTQLGLAIYEMGERRIRPSQKVELVFDVTGAARVTTLTAEDEDRRVMFWMNEQTPTFLKAEPECKRGDPCFEVAFNIDSNKRLLITARDLRNGETTHLDYPVVKLS